MMTIKKYSLMLALLVVSSEAPAQQTPVPQPNRSVEGRYQMFFSPFARKDTFLVDTVSGRTWRIVTATSLNGDPDIFEPVDIVDETGRTGIPYSKLVEIYGRKPKESK